MNIAEIILALVCFLFAPVYERYFKKHVWVRYVSVMAGCFLLGFAIRDYFLPSTKVEAQRAPIQAQQDTSFITLPQEPKKPNKERTLQSARLKRPSVDSSKIYIGPRSVVSLNQQGGQTAGTINNFAPQPRKLSAQQENVLIGILQQFPNSEIDITVAASDPEAEQFCTQLQSIFKKARWKITNYEIRDSYPSFFGLVLFVRSKQEYPPYAPFLQQALTHLGYATPGAVYKSLPANRTGLQIGHLPLK